MIRFTVDGIPRGQPRPRAFSRGGRAAVYDPGTAEGWKSCIAFAAARHRPASPLVGPIALVCRLYFPRPARLLRAKDPRNAIPHAAKPDADNAAKAVMDALTQLGFWGDDAQVCRLTVGKDYCAMGARPGAEIEISQI